MEKKDLTDVEWWPQKLSHLPLELWWQNQNQIDTEFSPSQGAELPLPLSTTERSHWASK